jgi:Acyl-protein synthetase, LuxE
MTSEFSNFATRVREFILKTELKNEPPHVGCYEGEFAALALELFGLQFRCNPAYRKICEARRLTPLIVRHWSQIPAVPTSAFKELELTCLPPGRRTHVFHSSGTTEQRPSRHFHSAESLEVYEASLWTWFKENCRLPLAACRLLCLTPPPLQAPDSSLVHMFEVIRRKLGADTSAFVGSVAADGAWALDFEAAQPLLTDQNSRPLLVLGTAFSFVHLLDEMKARNLHIPLPEGSRVMETGGYKGRSREMSKAELHALITERLGVPVSHIICEYGMSELSSQAYDGVPGSGIQVPGSARVFRFPPWARVQIVSPETGRTVAEGETGLIQVFDLANVFSVMAIQTEDLGVRRGDGFELIGRAKLAEPRGCSFMAI